MLIHVDNISLQFNGQRLLENTTWCIEEGQNWAILGPTGSGKSLLAKALCRQVPLTQGRVQYFFAEADRSQGHFKDILILSAESHQQFLGRFAQYHQARWQSLERNEAPPAVDLLSARSIAGISPYAVNPPLPDPQNFANQQAEVIRLLQLEPLLNRKMHLLSNGESRKLFIARLLLQSPRLLILDDPLVGLDPRSRTSLSSTIANLIRQQAAQVIFITTRAEEIPAGIEHVLVMRNCRAVAQGKRAALLNDPSLQALLNPTPAQNTVPKENPALQTITNSYAKENPYLDKLSMRFDQSSPAGCLPPPALVEMHNVAVQYGQTHILKNIHWTVREGERWALLGPNGAGKTTLLSLILADNPQAYANQVTLFGQRRGCGESIWEIKQKIGWVSPELHIHYRPNIACLDVVCSGFFDSIGLHRACTPAQTAAARNWLELLDMAAQAALSFGALSTGQQRLILLARALVKNPPLLILDEPCQGLDEAHRRIFIELLDQLCAATRLSLIYVTHYQDELPKAINHHLILEQGKIAQAIGK